MAPRSDSITMDSFKAMDNDEIIEKNENDDPAHIETVLTHELMKMSVEDRELIQEEIHGVRSLAEEETPEFLEQSLDLLQWELDQVIPPDKKYAFRKSQQLSETYVNTEDFRLRFLRCELFDAPKAAVRLCKFLDLVLELYGEYALQRPIRITDFTKLEMKYICKGRYQVLPFRDRGGIAGRRILSFFPDAEWEAIPPYLRNKILIYYTWVLGEDVNVQREGIVAIVWFDKTFQMSRKPAIQTKDRETMSVRASAIHCCTPDTPFYRLRRSVMTMRIGKDNRSRLAVHLGDSVEVLYKLHSYGIPTDHIPITSTGKIKTVYLKQWIKIREFIESPSTPNTHRVIESPYLSDILFRKGSKFASHPGNSALRAMIATKVRDEVMEDHKHCPPEDECKIQHPITRLGLFVSAILREIRDTSSNNFNGISSLSRTTPKASRFLVYNDKGFWEEIRGEDAIRIRVEHIARGVRSTIVKNHRACAIFAGRSSTSRTSSPTVSPNSPSPKVSPVIASTNIHPGLEIGLADTQIMSLRRTFQNQDGGTSMFRCLDHSESTTLTCLARDIKKRRLELE